MKALCRFMSCVSRLVGSERRGKRTAVLVGCCSKFLVLASLVQIAIGVEFDFAARRLPEVSCNGAILCYRGPDCLLFFAQYCAVR